MVTETTQNNKRIAKNTLMLYFRMLITMFVALYTSRIVLQVLGVSDYGLNNVVAGFVTLFTFVDSTLAAGTQRFITYSLGTKDCNKVKKVFATALALHLSIAFIFFIAINTFGLWFLRNKMIIPTGREVAAFWVFQFAAISTIAQIIQTPYNAALAAHEKFNIYAYMSIYNVVMKLLIVFIIQITDFDKLIFYSFLYTSVSLSSTFIYNIYCRKKFDECSFSFRGHFDKDLCKEIGTFSGWSLMGCTAALASGQGVNTLINMFLGTLVNAARGISVQITSVINQLVNSFYTAVNPQITKLYAEKRYDEMFSLAMNASKLGTGLMLILSIPLIVEMDYVLTLWLGKVPNHTVFFSICAIIQALISSISRPLVTILHAVGKMKLPNLYSGTTLLLIIPITYFMLKHNVDINIIIAVNIVPWMFQVFFSILLVKRLTCVNSFLYFTDVIFKLIIIVIVTFFPTYCIHMLLNESFGRLVSVFLCNSVILFICIFYILFDKNTRAKIIQFVKFKLKKINKFSKINSTMKSVKQKDG